MTPRKKPLFNTIVPLMREKTVMSLSGGSGTGKTSLALFLVGHSLTETKPYSSGGAWIQASEAFPTRRLKTIFAAEPEKLAYLSQHIYVLPRTLPFPNYRAQTETIKKILDGTLLLPPQIRFLVIDNISHHLRYELSKYHDLTKITSIMNSFFEAVLLPLVLYCNREKITLLLIHEVSYDPATHHNQPFYYKLYQRIDSLFITLETLEPVPSKRQHNKIMRIQTNRSEILLKYRIKEHGFEFLP